MIRELKVEPVLNGFIVKIGCQKVVSTDLKIMCQEIERYYKEPEKVEKEYLDNAINKTALEVAAVDPQPFRGVQVNQAECEISR